MNPEPPQPAPTEREYQRAARLLAQKLGVDWRTLPAEQVFEYARKIEIARSQTSRPPLDDDTN